MSVKPLALANSIKREFQNSFPNYEYSRKLMLNVDSNSSPVILQNMILGKTVTFVVEDDEDESQIISQTRTTIRSFDPEIEEDALLQLKTNTKSFDPEDVSEEE